MRYRPTDGCLIEAANGRDIVQRPWREGFRRHLVPAGVYEIARPQTGAWSFIGPTGLAQHPGMRDANRYLRGIPLPIRLLAGALPAHQWLALEAMRHVRGFARFLRQELTAGGPNFVLACWSLDETAARPRASRLDLARAMTTERRSILLERLTDIRFPEAHLRILLKAPPREVAPAFLRDLRNLLSCEAAAHALSQADGVTHAGLRALLALPPWMQHPAVTAAVLRDPDPDAVRRMMAARVAAAGDADRERILRSLRSARDCGEIVDRLWRWEAELRRDEPFPPPPLPGDHRLVPITSAAALEQEGREMAHCVANYEDHVRDGDAYYYRWMGAERATVELSRHDAGGWRVTQALGRANDELSEATLAAIEVAVARQAQWPVETYVAGLQYYEPARVCGRLRAGDPLVLRRQPLNPHDPLAIEVLTADGTKLGYVPRVVNRVPAAILDRGGSLEAQVAAVGGPGQDIRIRLAMRKERAA